MMIAEESFLKSKFRFLEKHGQEYLQALGHSFCFDKPLFGAAIFLMLLAADYRVFALAAIASLAGYAHGVIYRTPRAIKELITINEFFFGITMGVFLKNEFSFYFLLGMGILFLPLMVKALYEILQHWKVGPNFAPYIFLMWIVALASGGLTLAEGTTLITVWEGASLPLRLIRASLLGASHVFFLSNALAGLGIVALVMAFDFRRGLFFYTGCLLGTLITYLFFPDMPWEFGFLSYCSGLTGLLISASAEKINTRSILFFCCVTAVIHVALFRYFRTSQLPLFSLPYVLTYWFATLSRVPRVSFSWEREQKETSLIDWQVKSSTQKLVQALIPMKPTKTIQPIQPIKPLKEQFVTN